MRNSLSFSWNKDNLLIFPGKVGGKDTKVYMTDTEKCTKVNAPLFFPQKQMEVIQICQNLVANTAMIFMSWTHCNCQKQNSAESTRDVRDSQEEKQLTLPDDKLFPDPFGSWVFCRGSQYSKRKTAFCLLQSGLRWYLLSSWSHLKHMHFFYTCNGEHFFYVLALNKCSMRADDFVVSAGIH